MGFLGIFEGRVRRRLVAHHDVFAPQRQLDPDPQMPPPVSMAVRCFNQDTAAEVKGGALG